MAAKSSLKNICFFNSYTLWGGGEKWHFNAALRAKELGHQTYIISGAHGVLLSRAEKSGLNFFAINPKKNSYYSPLFLYKLYSFFKSEKIDVVVFNSPIDVRYGAIAAWAAGVRTIMMRSGMPIAPKNKWSNRLAFKKLTHIFGNCLEIKRVFLEEASALVSHVNFSTIYNGIHFDTNPIVRSSHSPLIIGSLSRLSEQKGIDLLLRSAKILKEKNIAFKMIIAGTGEDEERLKNLSNDLDLSPHVIFTGFSDKPKDFLQSIDILAFSSLWEGCSNTLIEAMSEELPIVCFDMSTMPEIITHEKTGLLAKEKDFADFAFCLERLIQDEELRKQLAKSARLEALSRFDYNKNIDQFFKLLD